MSLRDPKPPVPTRDDLEAAIENAIDMLNALDGDIDLEDGDEDCCEAYEDQMLEGALRMNACPGDVEDDEPDHEGEPSLGAPVVVDPTWWASSQEFWADRGRKDLEHETDDYELSGDEHEPSLGSLNTFSQANWSRGHEGEDRERDAGDEREGGDPDFEIDGGDAREEGDGDSEVWTQPVHTPLVHRDGIEVAWSQGARVDVKDAAE